MAGGPTAPDDERSFELLRRVQQGEREAFAELYARHRDPLLFAVRVRLGAGLRSQLESEDILQSVFRDVLSDIQRFEPRGSGSLARWLHTCVLNKIRSKAEHFGARKRAGTLPLGESQAEALAAPASGLGYRDGERWERLERALEHLGAQAREAVLLRSVEGLSNEEAARALGTTPAAASKLYTRALARLGIALASGGDRP